MTDFLSRLSERAVGQAPVLERRRPSLFEPVTGSVPLGHRQDDAAFRETTTEVVSEKPRSLQQSPRQTGPPADSNAIDRLRLSGDRRRETTREENSLTRPNAVSKSRSNRRAGESPSTPIIEKRAEVTPREEPRPSLRDRQTSVGPPEVRSELRVVETRIEREVVFAPPKASDSRETKDKAAELSPQPQPSILTPVVQPARAKPDVETKIETRVEKEFAPLAQRSDLQSPNTRLAQFAVPRVPSRRAPVPKLNAPPVPPSIQVTIGRVEVRATAAAPAKRATPSARPTLSLEDYLRGRSGESR